MTVETPRLRKKKVKVTSRVLLERHLERLEKRALQIELKYAQLVEKKSAYLADEMKSIRAAIASLDPK